MRTIDPRSWRWARIEPWAAAAVLGWYAFRLARGIGPDPLYNSDCAVPILLMQGLGEGPFTLYYPRQDRYGMWPFLVARWLDLGTPEAFHVFSVLALCSAALPLSRLLGGPALAVLTLLLPFLLNHLVSWNLFQAGQPYLWQIVALCWAWWACRASFTAPRRRGRALAAAGLAVSGMLAVWISTASVSGLLLIIVLEALRVRARPVQLSGPVVAVGLAALAEGQLRGWYNAFCEVAFGEQFITKLQLDRGHLWANVGPVLAGAWREGVVLPLLVGAALLPVPGRTRTERTNQAVLLSLALFTLPAFVLVRHFRDNFYAGRYFSFPAFWAVAAAAYGALVLLGSLAGARRAVIELVTLGVLVLAVSVSPRDPLAGQRAEALRLVGAEPRVLLGGYWEVYVPASLAPPGALLPIPKEGDYNRFPALQAELRPGRTVLAPCSMDGLDGTLEQRGALLRRTPDPPLPWSKEPWCFHAVERPARPLGPSGRAGRALGRRTTRSDSGADRR